MKTRLIALCLTLPLAAAAGQKSSLLRIEARVPATTAIRLGPPPAAAAASFTSPASRYRFSGKQGEAALPVVSIAVPKGTFYRVALESSDEGSLPLIPAETQKGDEKKNQPCPDDGCAVLGTGVSQRFALADLPNGAMKSLTLTIIY